MIWIIGKALRKKGSNYNHQLIPNMPECPPEKPASVAEITSQVKRLIERHMGRVYVTGEVSSPSLRGTTLYFELKGPNAVIKVVSFKHPAKNFEVRQGDQINIRGRFTTYERQSVYQIQAEMFEAAGQGDRHKQREALKRKLHAEGLFDATRKRPIPTLPRHIGLVTSSSGDAIRDFLKTLRQGAPNVHVLIHNTRVQGDQAAKEIAAAIRLLNRGSSLELIVVTRGGGSFDDLFCFSEEPVLRAIAASKLPVVSAVGHEADTPLSDFVADARAATPTAAAERIVRQFQKAELAIESLREAMVRRLTSHLERARHRLAIMARSPTLRDPRSLLDRRRERLGRTREAFRNALLRRAATVRSSLQAHHKDLQNASAGRVANERQTLDDFPPRMNTAARLRVREQRRRLDALQAQLRALSPTRVLERGFTITRRADGSIVRQAVQLQAGDEMITQFSDGDVRSRVEDSE